MLRKKNSIYDNFDIFFDWKKSRKTDGCSSRRGGWFSYQTDQAGVSRYFCKNQGKKVAADAILYGTGFPHGIIESYAAP